MDAGASPELYLVLSDPASIEPTSENEGSNAARLAIMAALGSPRDRTGSQSVQEVISPEDLANFGLSPDLILERLERPVAGGQLREALDLLAAFDGSWDPMEARIGGFQRLVNGDLGARLMLLAGAVGSSLERESVAAASAILTSVDPVDPALVPRGWRGWPVRFVDRTVDSLRFGGPIADLSFPPDADEEPEEQVEWDGEGWARYCSYWLTRALQERDPLVVLAAMRFLAQVRVEVSQRSSDPIVRELALAFYLRLSDGNGTNAPSGNNLTAERPATLSTMIHGTWGWKGSWWYHGGDFHTYVKRTFRPALYDGGQEFSWSGAYSDKQRAIGGARFKRWADAAGGPGGLATAFGHSYGGEIIARAVNAGARVDEVVLLSAPVHSHHLQMLSRVGRVVDVRLKFDIVLTLARAAQRLPAAGNVIDHLIDEPFWSHGATHSAQVWQQRGIAAATGL